MTNSGTAPMMGGTNFGLYYILKHMPAGADPLGPENVLTLMLSVLTGCPSPARAG